MRSDLYHTLYSLAGLSATQYHYVYDPHTANVEGDDDQAFKWIGSGSAKGDETDRVGMIHPLFVVPWGAAEKMRLYFLRVEEGAQDISDEYVD